MRVARSTTSSIGSVHAPDDRYFQPPSGSNVTIVPDSIVAAIFAALGIWLGLTINRKKAPSLAPPPSFAVDSQRLAETGITPRELEILGLMAAGLSNREIAERLFVSENTVKTHSSRLFDKLGARRRTQAVQLAKQARLIP